MKKLYANIGCNSEQLGKLTIEENEEQKEIIVTFRSELNPDTKLEPRSNSFDGKEAQFVYSIKREQAPQAERAKT